MTTQLFLRRTLATLTGLTALVLTACSQAPSKQNQHAIQVPEKTEYPSGSTTSRSSSQNASLLDLIKRQFGSDAVVEPSNSAHTAPTEHQAAHNDSDDEGKVELSELKFDAVEMADSLTGVPYRSGGSNPKGFDCSGLVYYVYAQLGIKLPRSSREQMHSTVRIEDDELEPGDLLFFRTPGATASHVGIYTGNHRFIHAPSRGKVVSYSSMEEPYWRKHYLRAGRIFN